MQFDQSIAIYVVHLEGPLEFLFGRSTGRHVDGEKKLLEVDVAIVVSIKQPKYMLAELLSIAVWKKGFVHVGELVRSEAPIRAVLLESSMPLSDGGLVVRRVPLEEIHVFFAQLPFAAGTSHFLLTNLEDGRSKIKRRAVRRPKAKDDKSANSVVRKRLSYFPSIEHNIHQHTHTEQH